MPVTPNQVNHATYLSDIIGEVITGVVAANGLQFVVVALVGDAQPTAQQQANHFWLEALPLMPQTDDSSSPTWLQPFDVWVSQKVSRKSSSRLAAVDIVTQVMLLLTVPHKCPSNAYHRGRCDFIESDVEVDDSDVLCVRLRMAYWCRGVWPKPAK